MADKLNGRLEVVKIEEPLSAIDNRNYVELLRDKREVTVRNALPYEGRSCLVRFDLRDGLHRPEPEGYFISSVVPPLFDGLAAEQYVLMVLSGETSSNIPTLPGVEQLYRPGNMPLFRYFQKEFSQKGGVYIVDNHKINPDHGTSVSRYIRRFDLQHAVCVFILDAGSDLEKIITTVKNQNLHPIMMEPLHQPNQKV